MIQNVKEVAHRELSQISAALENFLVSVFHFFMFFVLVFSVLICNLVSS